ncbi:MAG: alpha/beta hydrolase family protein [Solirubrobacterales bacterium]
MVNLSLKEKMAFKFFFGEKIYERWYGRFLSFGVDYWRMKRVISRINNWFMWCEEWSNEGDEVYKIAEEALKEGYVIKAKALFHEATACYHIGQHIFFIDSIQKERSQEKARVSYKRAISLYSNADRPIAIEIPFNGISIHGYLRLAYTPNKPLVIFINGMDNIKEAEGHAQGTIYKENGFNFFTFDGPGQGELWKDMKFNSKDYHKVVSGIIDWFMKNNEYRIDLSKIALAGFSLGGYLAPMCTAYDSRVKCTVGNSGLVYIGGLEGLKKLNPIWQRGVTYMTGFETLEEAVVNFNWDIEESPNLQVPLLFYHAGKDEVMPSPKTHANKIMNWAKGEKQLKYYEDGEHCTQNYLDEVFPEIIDWLKIKLE